MENKPRFIQLKKLHFQLTKNCNLRCPFCGQWGNAGFFSKAKGEILPPDAWKRIALQIKSRYVENGFPLPEIVLWGGEPLTSPHFDELTKFLYELGFPLSLITNGTLKNKHENAFSYFRSVYLSVDGDESLHDSIRGKGVYSKLLENFRKRHGDYELIINAVLTKKLMELLVAGTDPFEPFQPNKVLLQDKIFLTEPEIAQYKRLLSELFQTDATDIDSWFGQAEQIEKTDEEKLIQRLPDHYRLVDHGGKRRCNCVYYHAHIAWNGDVLYCTDFYDFVAGNVLRDDLFDVLDNDRSRLFRKTVAEGRLPTCAHCSWSVHDFSKEDN